MGAGTRRKVRGELISDCVRLCLVETAAILQGNTKDRASHVEADPALKTRRLALLQMRSVSPRLM